MRAAMHARGMGQSAAQLISTGQVVVAAGLVLLAIAEAAAFGPLALLRAIVGVVIVFYVVFVGFKIALWWASDDCPQYTLPAAEDESLPRYTILVPLRGEAKVVAKLVEALCRLRYPVAKLEILLLLEGYDLDTRTAVERISLPPHFHVLVVPDAGPRTKPKACNFGYVHASGHRLVIFDAEDRPEPDQLLRAVAAFRAIRRSQPDVGCLQAQLAFWNPRGSWVSSFYWSEYVVHFQRVLPGLARLGLIPPLGGTSNHFTVDALDAVADANGVWTFDRDAAETVTMRGPWDPYNVTEDADLAFRLALSGYRIGMFSSITYEEAPDTPRKARNQRSRWLQGYAQTGLVHTRHPLRSIRRVGSLRYLAFILFMLGTFSSLLLNPVMWAMTILYIVCRVESLTEAATFIHGLFPGPVYYAGMSVAIAGNAALFYQKLITPVRRQQQAESEAASDRPEQHPLGAYLSREQYGLCFRLLFTPLWWAFTSVSAYRAARKLLTGSQRSHWDKTPHGHALLTETELEKASIHVPASLQSNEVRQHVAAIPQEP
jgi:cellulose synthase/poly-beta-1,6-N-acetylglucosamine synthase-like glycosyltransferase